MNPEDVRRELDQLVRHAPEMARVARILGPVVLDLIVQVARNTQHVEENMERLDKLEEMTLGRR